MLRLNKHLLFTTAMTLSLSPVFSHALPTGGSVSSGSASISTSGNQTIVSQSTPKAVINWTGFNTTKGQSVTFNDQQGSNSVTLNRVSGAATTFDGSLFSNGSVWVINPNGVLIGSTGTVNTAGFLATTSKITDANFMNGNYSFTPGGNAGASVTNQGNITIADTGMAALIAPNVANSGSINFTGNVINAKAGTIALAAGDEFTVDLAGDGLLNIEASPALTKASVTNSGTLDAYSAGHSGSVVLTAAQGAGLLDSAINLNGVVEATSLTGTAGTINDGGKFTPTASGGTFALTATGNVTLDNAQIGAANNSNPVNVSLVTLGNTPVGSSVSSAVSTQNTNINTGGGSLDINAGQLNINPFGGLVNDTNGSILLNAGTKINTDGGNVYTVSISNTNAVDGSINNAGIVSIFGGLPGANTANGLYLNNFTINSSKGWIDLGGQAAPTGNGSATGLNIIDSTINAPNDGLNLAGYAGVTTKGASTGVNINGDDLYAGNINIFGESANLGSTASVVVGGAADGTVIAHSNIGNTNTQSVSITGQGGVASGYAAEGLVIGSTNITASGTPVTQYGPGGSTVVPSTVTLNGFGGTGTNTTGIDASYGQVNVSFSNQFEGVVNINGSGGKSSAGGVDAGVIFANTGGSTAPEFSGNTFFGVGTLNITGTGGSGTNSVNGSGVELAWVHSQAANTAITGHGGTGSGYANYGVQLAGANDFEAIVPKGSVAVTGTGTGNAYDIYTNESLTPNPNDGAPDSYLNYINLTPGTGYSLTGTRSSLSLNDLVVQQEE
jgi:filamentous hemagglutinin family protein